MKPFIPGVILFVLATLNFNVAISQSSAVFTVEGEVLRQLKLSVKDLSALKNSEVKAKKELEKVLIIMK